MASFDVGHHAAELFAWLWPGHRSPTFLRYVETSCTSGVADLPSFRAVVLSEAEAGNVEHGWVQSIAIRWWLADDAGFRAVAYENLPPWWGDHNEAADAGRPYYLWPRVHFFIDGNRRAFYERFGPELYCCKVGWVAVRNGSPLITDVRLVRNTRSPAMRPGPVLAELEIETSGPRHLRNGR
jgi:hypothetical protein